MHSSHNTGAYKEIFDLRRNFIDDMNAETRAETFKKFSDKIDDLKKNHRRKINAALKKDDPMLALSRLAQSYYNIASDLRDMRRMTPLKEQEPFVKGSPMVFGLADDTFDVRRAHAAKTRQPVD